MGKKFLVIYESSNEKEIAKWWENQSTQHVEASVFETFIEARSFIRAEIQTLFSDCAENVTSRLFDGWIEEDGSAASERVLQIKDIVEAIISNPQYFPKEIEKIQVTDDGDHYFAFVCNEKYVIANNYDWGLKFNIHNMDDENKYYYFELYNNEECVALFKLINTEETVDDSSDDDEDVVDWKQIAIGAFVQTDGDAAETIVWDVIDETNDKYFVVSHNCLDYRVFNDGRNSSNWEKSELRKWLNGEFYDSAFSEAEKDRILLTTVNNGKNMATKDNIFLLNKEEFFMLAKKNRCAGLTKYARAKYSEVIYEPYREPYGFWWLREYIKDKGGYDLTHVCANGTLNGFARSDSSHPNGIRPAMWIKK